MVAEHRVIDENEMAATQSSSKSTAETTAKKDDDPIKNDAVEISESRVDQEATKDDLTLVSTAENGNSEETVTVDEQNDKPSCSSEKDNNNGNAVNTIKITEDGSSSFEIIVMGEDCENERMKQQQKRSSKKIVYRSNWSNIQKWLMLLIVILFILWAAIYLSYVTGYPLPFVRQLCKSWFNI